MCHGPHHQDNDTEVDMYSMLDYLDYVTVWNTTSHDEMSAKVENLIDEAHFGNGSKELTFKGLKTALELKDEHNFICVFSDEVGEDTNDETLKQEIINLRDTTKSKIFFFLIPFKETVENMKPNLKDIGEVIDIESHNKEETLEIIMKALGESEICEEVNHNEED